MTPSPSPLANVSAIMRLLDVTRRLAKPFDLVELLNTIVEEGRAILHADRGSVFLYDKAAGELYTVVATGVESIRVSVDVGLAGLCARHRQTVNVDDCYANPLFNRKMDAQTGYCTTCCISIPLIGVEDELVGVMQMLNAADGRFSGDDIVIAEVAAAQAATAIQRVRLIDERLTKLKLERDLALARDIQQALLPRTAATCPGYDVACFNKPADDTGGDIFDLIQIATPDGKPMLVMLMADATGHGIGPALSVSQFRAMVRVGLRYNVALDHLIAHVNEQVAMDLPEGRFITAFVGELNPATHRLTYHAAGQGPVLCYAARTGEWESRPATTLPLGVVPELPDTQPAFVDLLPGDMVVLLTDGFYEYMDAAGRQFGEARVIESITQHRSDSSAQILDALREDLRHFAGGALQGDDLTAIVVKRTA